MRFAIAIGTRPEIIMATPIIEELRRRKIKHFVIHSGQHYDFEMARVFFNISIKKPDYFLSLKKGGEMEQFGDSLKKFYDILSKTKPDATIVVGDTLTTITAAIASAKLGIPLIHVESGNRTFDISRIEELYRILVDHIAQMLFCEGSEMKQNLINEGVERKRIFVTGSPKFDMTYRYREKIDKNILKKLGVKTVGKKIVLVTFHRQENVDNPKILKEIVRIISKIGKDNVVLFPMHPRIRKRLNERKISFPKNPNINLFKPLSYPQFISLVSKSDLVITDSGGVPREAFVFGVPTIMLHNNFDLKKIWKKTLFISGYDEKKIIRISKKLLRTKKRTYANPYGDGNSSKKIVSLIMRNKKPLKIPSPDYSGFF